VAETFQQLNALFPDRIDLGLGRATAGPVIDAALRRDRRSQPTDDHAEQVAELLAWLGHGFAPEHPFAAKPLMPSVPGAPETWLLGSSASSGGLAAALAMSYTFASFINPGLAAQTLRRYRAAFAPAPADPSAAARAMLAVNVTVADTAAEAQRLALCPKGFLARLTRGEEDRGVPTPEEALAELTPAQREEPTAIVDGRWPRFVAGDPDQVRATLDRMVAEAGADELMVQDLIAAAEDRRRSHELLAGAYALAPRSCVPV
jgi:luciferase family oxidoreductase group 1